MFAAQLLILFVLTPVSVPACAQDQPLTAEAIMARVGANQDRSDQLRAEYIYRQHIHIATRKGKKLMREESADYTVTPVPDGTQKQLTSITGRYWHKGEYVDFKGEPVPEVDSLDGDLIRDFRNDLESEHSKDGFARDYFPLTTEEQKKYSFRLIGEETLQGRRVYHVGFRPRDKQDFDWAGEAYVDANDFQPVTVFTKLSRQIPFLIRTFLADLPGIGFNVQYRRQPDGVWFPSSFGTEFRLRVLMFLSRDIAVSLENADFQHTHVSSRITPQMQ